VEGEGARRLDVRGVDLLIAELARRRFRSL